MNIGLVAFLLLVGINNLYVYLHETKDFPERITRREMADMVAGNVRAGQKLYAPIMPLYDDFIDWDKEYLQFVVWSTAPVGEDADYYRLLPYDELLLALAEDAPSLSGASILYDHGTNSLRAEREAIIAAIKRCYPGLTIQPGERFDVLVIPEQALREPLCTAELQVLPVGPTGTVASGLPIMLTWKTSPPDAGTSAQVELAQRAPGVVWLEAEDLFETPGWYVEGRFAPHFSGRGYVGDWYEAEDVTTQVILPAAGRYTVWVRTHRRETTDMPFAVIVAGQTFPAAQHTPSEFNTWRWERLGELDLGEEPVSVTLHRDYGEGRHMSVFIDALVFSSEPDYDPADGLWPIYFRSQVVLAANQRFVLSPASTPLGAAEMLSGRQWPVRLIVGDRLVDATLIVSDPELRLDAQPLWELLSKPPPPAAAQVTLPPGQYRWRVRVLDGDRIIGPSGDLGRWSAWTEFSVE